MKKYQKEHLFGVCSGRLRCALFDLEKLKLDFIFFLQDAEILDKDLNIIQDFPMKKEIVQQIFNEYHQLCTNSSYKQEMQNVFYTTLKEDY